MQGGYRKPRVQHDFSQYRDPEPPPIKRGLYKPGPKEPEIMPEVLDREETEINLKSRTNLIDLLRKLGPLDRPKVPTTVTEVKKVQNNLLRKLTRPQTRELKKFDLSPDMYLLYTLAEDGYPKTEERMRRFMEIDDRIREYQDLPPLDLTREPLRMCKSQLKILSETLKQSEDYSKKQMREKEFTLLLHLARYLEAMDSTWAWLCYEVYMLAREAARSYTKDQGYGEALINYLFGKMLLQKLKMPEESISVLKTAHGLSIGKSWSAFSITEDDEEEIHRQTCICLFQALLEQAEIVSGKSPALSVPLVKKALIIAKEMKEKNYIEEATLTLGVYFLKTREPEKAIGRLIRLLEHSDEKIDQDTLCNCYLLMGLCYKSTGDHRKAFQCLKTLLDFSRKWLRVMMFAIANRYLGEYHLYKGNYNVASVHFDVSHNIFLHYEMLEDIDITGVLYGIAKSYTHKPDYMDILVDEQHPERLDGVINWKNHALPFWVEDNTESLSEVQDEEAPTHQRRAKKSRKKHQLEPLQCKPILPSVMRLMKSIQDKSKVVFKI